MSVFGALTWFLTCLLAGLFAFQGPAPVISSPQEGDLLQGTVVVSGSSAVENFAGLELAYTYQGGSDWFLITQSEQPVQTGPLGNWDTTAIADGDHQLRLRVLRQRAEPLEMVVQHLQVRNYTPGATRLPVSGTPIAAPVESAVAGLLPTPTRLPDNPAEIHPFRLALSAVQGVIFVLVIFGLFGLYLAVRAGIRRIS